MQSASTKRMREDEDTSVDPSPSLSNRSKTAASSIIRVQSPRNEHPAADTTTAATTSSSTASFLSSMTFAAPSRSSWQKPDELSMGRVSSCECDECGISSNNGSSFYSVIPNAIQKALTEYQRHKKLSSRVRRTQQRQLMRQKIHVAPTLSSSLSVSKEDDDAVFDINNNTTTSAMISIWQWALPLQADPLLEFGDSHRFIYIQRGLPLTNNSNLDSTSQCTEQQQRRSVLMEIGTGIIGSSAEQLGRRALNDWTDGRVFFVPSRKGKAIGWVHEKVQHRKEVQSVSKQDEKRAFSETANTGSAGKNKSVRDATDLADHVVRPVVLYVVKVTPAALSRVLDRNNNTDADCSGEASTTAPDAARTATSAWYDLVAGLGARLLQKHHDNGAWNERGCYFELDAADAESIISICDNSCTLNT